MPLFISRGLVYTFWLGNPTDKILDILGEGTFGKVVECFDRSVPLLACVRRQRVLSKHAVRGFIWHAWAHGRGRRCKLTPMPSAGRICAMYSSPTRTACSDRTHWNRAAHHRVAVKVIKSVPKYRCEFVRTTCHRTFGSPVARVCLAERSRCVLGCAEPLLMLGSSTSSPLQGCGKD